MPKTDSSMSIQIDVMVFDDMPDLGVVIYLAGVEVGNITDNFTFIHSGLLAGVENNYTAAVLKNGE